MHKARPFELASHNVSPVRNDECEMQAQRLE